MKLDTLTNYEVNSHWKGGKRVECDGHFHDENFSEAEQLRYRKSFKMRKMSHCMEGISWAKFGIVFFGFFLVLREVFLFVEGTDPWYDTVLFCSWIIVFGYYCYKYGKYKGSAGFFDFLKHWCDQRGMDTKSATLTYNDDGAVHVVFPDGSMQTFDKTAIWKAISTPPHDMKKSKVETEPGSHDENKGRPK